MHRLRRRIANRALLEQSDRMAAAFFSRLPESSKGLKDVATDVRRARPSEVEAYLRRQLEAELTGWRELSVAIGGVLGQG